MEALVAVLIQEELRLSAEVADLFQTITRAWEHAAELATDSSGPALTERLRGLRAEIDEDFTVAKTELESNFGCARRRLDLVMGHLVADLKADLLSVGTPDLSPWSRRYGRVYSDRNHGVHALGQGYHGARNAAASRWCAVALNIELAGLEGRIHDVTDAYGAKLERDLRGKGATQLRRVDSGLAEWLQRAAQAVEAHTQPNLLAQELRDLYGPLRHTITSAHAEARVLRQELSSEDSLTPLWRSLLTLCSGLSERYDIPSAPIIAGDWALPEQVDAEEVPFRELVVAVMESSVTVKLVELSRDLAFKSEQLDDGLAEVERNVPFNVELACRELDHMPKDTQLDAESRTLITEIVIGSVARTKLRTDRLLEQAEPWAAEAHDSLRAAVLTGVDALRGHVLEGDVSKLKLLLRADVGRRRFTTTASAWLSWMPTTGPQITTLLTRSLGDDRAEGLRRSLGLPLSTDHEEAQLRAFAPPAEQVPLPEVYRRLFSRQALHAGDLVLGRELELRTLDSVISGQRGRHRVAAIVGPRGSGTSALATAAARSVRGSVRRLQPTAPVSAQQVHEWFSESHHGVTLLSGLRWLFVNKPGGYGPLTALMGHLAGGSSAWTITVDSAVWSQLVSAMGVDSAMATVIHVGPMSASNLGAAVLARHQLSGFDLEFDASNDVSWQLRRLVLRGVHGHQRHQAAWFANLTQASGGVIHDALLIWQASVQRVSESSNQIVLGPVIRPPLARLSALPDSTLVALYAIVRQGWVSAPLLAEWLRLEPERASAELARLSHTGLLSELDNDRFEVSTHLHGALLRVLGAKGWLR